jgi:hypothetical protein
MVLFEMLPGFQLFITFELLQRVNRLTAVFYRCRVGSSQF